MCDSVCMLCGRVCCCCVLLYARVRMLSFVNTQQHKHVHVHTHTHTHTHTHNPPARPSIYPPPTSSQRVREQQRGGLGGISASCHQEIAIRTRHKSMHTRIRAASRQAQRHHLLLCVPHRNVSCNVFVCVRVSVCVCVCEREREREAIRTPLPRQHTSASISIRVSCRT